MAKWRKVVVSGSTAELNHISASGDLVPVSDAGGNLGSTSLEWNNLWVDGTANIDSLVADTADINGGTVDGITSLTAGGDLDIGSHDLRAATLTADGLTNGRVVFAGSNGVLSDDSDLSFSSDTLTATQIAGTTIKNFATISGSVSSTGSFGALTVKDGVTETLSPVISNGSALGTTTNMWSDLFLADGAVINFNNGDITATHSSNLLNIEGGSTRVDKLEIDGANDHIDVSTDMIITAASDITLAAGGANVKPNADNSIALGVSGTAFSDLFLGDGAVINFNAGDITLTHSSNALTVGGGNLLVGGNKVSGSIASTGSFGRVEATKLAGDGSEITGLTSAAIDSTAGMTNNYILTATAATAVTGEANLQFDGTHMLIAGAGKIQFRDAGDEYIYSVSDGTLGITAGTEVDITATTIDMNGAVDVSGNLTVGGNLDVNGTLTTIDTANTTIKDKFMILASGSTSDTDGGVIVQNAAGAGYALGYDSGVDRWAFDADLAHDATNLGPDAYVGVVEVGTGAGSAQGNPVYGGGTNGVGTIYIDTDDGEIWIFA
tara:strand:+ start:621 stop:2273 length:1653 start_codon:yes stop_codon:yes gene_type:complete